MTPIILFRECLAEEGEHKAAKRYFNVVHNRSDIFGHAQNNPKPLIIPRYSALPYYKEMEYDIGSEGGYLVNTWEQFNWIANFEWYEVPELRENTFETWDDCNFCDAPEGPYIVKGRANSKKEQWSKLMFSPNKHRAGEIGCELHNDTYIGCQGIIYRKYEKLRTLEVGMWDLPITYEFRFFYYKNQLLGAAYYWSIAEKTDYEVPEDLWEFAEYLANIISKYNNFFAIDIAKKESGEWVLTEINSGEMSGLSEINPYLFYKRLKEVINDTNN